MRRKIVSGILLSLLFVGMLILTFNIQPAKASGTIYIRADGSVEPSTANIISMDNVTYYFTGNINESIVVERDNIVVDGAGYTVQGTVSGTGIDLSYRSNVTIKNMEIKEFLYGVYLYESSNNTIRGNNITNNNSQGIWLSGSSNNTISGNNITNNYRGISLGGSNNNTVYGNTITNNNHIGIALYQSSNNTLRNNDASNNTYNFGVYGYLPPDYIHDMDDSNTVDGKPVYYWVNRRDMTVPLDAGYVALINCTCMTVKNLDLANNWQGVLLALTTNSTITKNNITNNEYGIEIVWSSNYNTISGNTITNGVWGIGCAHSSSNIIYHNNFIDNQAHPQVRITNSNNTWDDGYPTGGNYWSDHDCNHNPSDGSQPYIIDENNMDHYPFQDPNGWLLTLFGDLNEDRKVDMRDISLAAAAFGSYPDHPRWNPIADVNEDNKVDMRDLATIARNFGKTV